MDFLQPSNPQTLKPSIPPSLQPSIPPSLQPSIPPSLHSIPPSPHALAFDEHRNSKRMRLTLMNILFDPIEEVLEEIRQGHLVIVTDDAHRENEGDLILAA